MLEKIANPQAPRTFAASKLIWRERLSKTHAQTLELYKTCLALRASDSAFRPLGRQSWQGKKWACGIGAMRPSSSANTLGWSCLILQANTLGE
jgi:hypothetical protein